MPAPEISLLMTVKDRPQFTENFLHYWKKNLRERYALLIADGGKDNAVERLVFEKLSPCGPNIKYKHFGYDENIQKYLDKIRAAVGEIESEYVLLVDDDDYLIPEGVDASVAFLKSNPDYIAAMGDPCHLWLLQPDANGFRARSCWIDLNHGILRGANEESDPEQRLANYSVKNGTWWNAVFRTKDLGRIFDALSRLKSPYLHVYELVFNFLTVSMGKTRVISGVPMYVRSTQTANSSSATATKEQGGWKFFMVKPEFSAIVTRCVDLVVQASAGKISRDTVTATFAECYSSILAKVRITPSRKSASGPVGTLRQFAKSVLPNAVVTRIQLFRAWARRKRFQHDNKTGDIFEHVTRSRP